MTGQDFQDRLDALVDDLQTIGKGKTVNIMFRNDDNTPRVLPLSSDAGGAVNAAQLAAIQGYLDDNLKGSADDYEIAYAPVKNALEIFKTAQQPHEALMAAAAAARKNLTDALEADADYQMAKNALDAARANLTYINAATNYRSFHVSENYVELQSARGKYSL